MSSIFLIYNSFFLINILHLFSDKKLALRIDQMNDVNDVNSILVKNADIILSVDIPSVIKTVKDWIVVLII